MWSNKYVEIPFAEHGRSLEGCDCWGLACVIYKQELGINLPELLDYKNTKDSQTIAELYKEEHQRWTEISEGGEKPFDILIFNVMGLPTHVGIVITKGLMIHCEYGIGTHVTEYKRELAWKKRLVGIYRYER